MRPPRRIVCRFWFMLDILTASPFIMDTLPVPRPVIDALPLVRAEGLSRRYTRGSEIVDALADFSLDIQRGAFAVVLGPSGCGKSTLLHLLGGIERPSQGSVTVNGVALERASETELTRFRRHSVGFVFQFYNLLPFISAEENVALPLLAIGRARPDALRAAREELDQMGLLARRRHRPAELSGGEQQRVAIARAVIGRPDILVADEPTGNVDADMAKRLIGLFEALNRLGTTIVIATHDLPLIAQISHAQMMRLDKGHLIDPTGSLRFPPAARPRDAAEGTQTGRPLQ